MRLHVNIDHVATVRQARGTVYPDPIYAAQVCDSAGADGITLHLREDRRHIGDRDVERLRAAIMTLMNLECAANDEMVDIAARIRPDVVTFVPERRQERTTEGGLDVVREHDTLMRHVSRLRNEAVRVSLFIGADSKQIAASRSLGVDQVEFHTGPYAHARGDEQAKEREVLVSAAREAKGLGLAVAAGHGLTRANVGGIASIAEVEELNIGHAIIADAIFMGLAAAVRAMREAIDRARPPRG